MGMRLERVRDELVDFWDEVYYENHVIKRRYGKPREWVHVWTDLFVSAFEHMHYTLGHLFAVGIPAYCLYKLFT